VPLHLSERILDGAAVEALDPAARRADEMMVAVAGKHRFVSGRPSSEIDPLRVTQLGE
jgi:hypothetical protein